MKHIYKGLVLCATLAFAYTHTAAQEPLADMLELLKLIRSQRCKWHSAPSTSVTCWVEYQ